MKILFLEIDTEKTWALASTGPAAIAAYIRAYGHEATFFRVLANQDPDDIIGHIEMESPDILGFSLTTRQWRRAADLADAIRETLDIPVIAGGSHPTFLPESVLRAKGFDYVCLGEGEEALCELLSNLEKGYKICQKRIENIWVKGGTRPALRAPFRPMDAMPFVDRDFLDEKHGVIYISTQRGCPFLCASCVAEAMNTLYKTTGYVRRRSIHHVIAELKQIRAEHSLNYVIFLDDTFTVNREWIDGFCRLYGPEFGTGFSINARVETVNRKMLGTLSRAGCRHIVYGVESGSMQIRRDVLNRPVTNRRIIDVFNWTKAENIMVTANYMIGLPGETPQDIEQTLALHAELDPDDFGCFVFYPYPGTSLFHVCRQKGFLSDNYLEIRADNRHSVLNMPALTKHDIDYFYETFAALRKRELLKRRL